MVWIRSKTNGNVFDVEDVDRAKQLVDQGHEAFDSDPRESGAKPLHATAPTFGVPIDVQPKQAGSTTPAKYPAGEPAADWQVKQLKAYARDRGVELDGARTKPEILAALLTAGEDDDLDDEDLDDEDLDDDEIDDEDPDEPDGDEDQDDESDTPVDAEDETESKDS
ncbi:hypothetical protein [Promicromonospora sp. NFX87]|uniref:hypothetical protein n=1 Tax=Promicromonospora sp. NFX87 TaxID=3402691 RepID=UPI003AFAE017